MAGTIFSACISRLAPWCESTLDSKQGFRRSIRESCTASDESVCKPLPSVIDTLRMRWELRVVGGWDRIDESGKLLMQRDDGEWRKVEGLTGLGALLLNEPERFYAHGDRKLRATRWGGG